MPDTELIEELEARDIVMDGWHEPTVILTPDERDSLIATVKQLRGEVTEYERTDLVPRSRYNAADAEAREAREQTKQLAQRAGAEIESLQSQLEQLRAENERLQTELEKESHIADDYAVEADNFRTHMIELCKGKSAELRTKAERAHNAGHLMVRDGYNTQSRAIDEVREELEKLT